MSGALAGLYAGEVWAGGIAEAQHKSRIRQANRNLEIAEKYHRGTLALTSALRVALQAQDPGNPLLNRLVADRIKDIGEAAASFDEAGRIKIDAQAIKDQLEIEHRAKQATTLAKIENTPITEGKAGWFWARVPIWQFANAREHSLESAHAVKQKALSLVRAAELGDTIEFAAVIQAANRYLDADKAAVKALVDATSKEQETPVANPFTRVKLF